MKYLNGQIYVKRQGTKTLYYYPDGRLKTEIESNEGQLHGTVRLYWPNGKLKRQTTFQQGIREKDEYFPP